MLQPDAPAPTFTLPGTDGDAIEQYSLQDFTASGPAILLFYPFDFSPVCTVELCGIRDAEWLQMADHVDVLGISTDSAYAHKAYINEYDLPFPLLSDNRGRVSEQYDVQYESLADHERVSKRSVFVVDTTQTVRYAWRADDASDAFELDVIREAAQRIDPLPSVPDP